MNLNNTIENFLWHLRKHKILTTLLIFNLVGFLIFQESFFAVFFFVFLLFFAGTLMVQQMSFYKMLWAYAGGFLTAAIVFYLWEINNNTVAYEPLILSAMQAAILSILTTITLFNPNHAFRVFFIAALKLKYITAVIIILNLLGIENPAVYLAHASAALFGAFYGWSLKMKWDKSWLFKKRKKSKMHVAYKNERPLSDEQYNAIRAEKQKKIDKILEKISKSGYDSLTKDEKELLFKAGNNS